MVLACYVCSDDALANQPVGVDSTCQLVLMEYTQVQVGLGHPPQCRLKSSVMAITDIIQSEPYLRPGFSPPSTCSPLLAVFPVIPRIPYQWRLFIHPSLPISATPCCHTLPTCASHVPSRLHWPVPLVVPSLYPTPTPTPTPGMFTLAHSTPERLHTRAVS